jgi:hypothetical protein
MRSWIGRAIVFSLTVILAGGIGFYFGVQTRAANIHKQIECLKMMWGEPLTLSQHERVRVLQDDPEAVRASFSTPFEKRVGLALVVSSSMPKPSRRERGLKTLAG